MDTARVDEFTKLRALLLAELELLLLDRRDPYIDTVDRIADSQERDRYLQRHHENVVARLRKVQEPYSGILTALFDLEHGLDRVRWVNEALAANEGIVRDRMVLTDSGMTFLQSVYERHDILVKKIHRGRLVAKAVEDELLLASRTAAEADPATQARHAAVHHAFVTDGGIVPWARGSDMHEFWKISALWWESDQSILSYIQSKPDPDIELIQQFWKRRTSDLESLIDKTLQTLRENLILR